MEMRTLVIINNAAARARRAWPEIKVALDAHNLRFDDYETRSAGDATTRVRAALKEGYQTIAVIGGDGTLSEAAMGFFEFDEKSRMGEGLPRQVNREAALAILPAGTGDDFARGLTGKRGGLEHWIKTLVAHSRFDEQKRARAVDVIYAKTQGGASEFICLNAITMGIGAEVATYVGAQGRIAQALPGEARFVSAALRALARWRERRTLIKVVESGAIGSSLESTTEIECASNLIAIANGVYAGGGMMFAPGARVDDGLMDVLLACDGLTRASILRELPRIRRGAHLSNPRVRAMRATRVCIETDDQGDALMIEADGNVRGHTPAEFRIMPGALRVVS